MPSGEHLKNPDSCPPAPNKQLFSGSLLEELFVQAGKADDALFNGRDPNLQIRHEKPEHRYLLWMKAQGASNREIAAQSGYSEAWLSQLFRQPWAQETLVKMLKESGKPVLDQTLELIQSEAVNSVQTLVQLRDDPESPAAVRRACSVDIIEQFLGKPKQKVEVDQTSKIDDIGELDKRIEELEKQEQQLRGNLTHV